MKYLVDFKDTATEAEIQDYLLQNNATVEKSFSKFTNIFLVSADTEPPVTDIVDHVVDDDGYVLNLLGDIVISDQHFGLKDPSLPDLTISTTDNNDWWKNYVLKEPVFDEPTVSISRKGAGASVYIMDSGIKADHPEFVNANIVNLFTVTDNFEDTNGHGTALASIIVGDTCGLSNAKIKVVKIFESGHSTKQSELLAALDAIYSDFEANSGRFSVVNCSWSIPKNTLIDQRIQQLCQAGLYFVAASGNSGVPIDDVTPASIDEVITIGSFGKDLTPSDFSNYTDPSAVSYTPGINNTGELDGWAPGEGIRVATLDGGYGMSAGTSLSAAIHSCVLAYNLDDYLDEDSKIMGLTQRQSNSLVASVSLSRNGILDLSAPEYSGSVNRISTLINSRSFSSLGLDRPFYTNRIPVGTSFSSFVFNPHITDTVEILTPLPPSFKIIPQGFLIGEPTSVEGSYQIFTSSIRITPLSGESFDKELKIAVVGANFDPSTVPADDPDLAITLLVDYFCSTTGTSIPAADNCIDDCGAVGCNNTVIKPGDFRNCLCFF